MLHSWFESCSSHRLPTWMIFAELKPKCQLVSTTAYLQRPLKTPVDFLGWNLLVFQAIHLMKSSERMWR